MEARGSWRAEEERRRRSSGVLARIASPYGKSFFKLLQKDLHVSARWGGEGFTPHNLSRTLLSEGRPWPS